MNVFSRTSYAYNIIHKGMTIKQLIKDKLILPEDEDEIMDEVAKTHKQCKECDTYYPKNSYCDICYEQCDICKEIFDAGEIIPYKEGDEMYLICKKHRKGYK